MRRDNNANFAISNQVDVLSRVFRRQPIASMGKPLNYNTSTFGNFGADNVYSQMGSVQRNEPETSSDAKSEFQSNVLSHGSFPASSNVETVAQVLGNSGLSKYIELFREQEVSFISICHFIPGIEYVKQRK